MTLSFSGSISPHGKNAEPVSGTPAAETDAKVYVCWNPDHAILIE